MKRSRKVLESPVGPTSFTKAEARRAIDKLSQGKKERERENYMSCEYVPEKWRKKFKKGQTVWFLDHMRPKVCKGTFARYYESKFDYADTVIVQCPDIMVTERILEEWVFTNKKSAKQRLSLHLQQQIDIKEQELKTLKKLLWLNKLP